MIQSKLVSRLGRTPLIKNAGEARDAVRLLDAIEEHQSRVQHEVAHRVKELNEQAKRCNTIEVDGEPISIDYYRPALLKQLRAYVAASGSLPHRESGERRPRSTLKQIATIELLARRQGVALGPTLQKNFGVQHPEDLTLGQAGVFIRFLQERQPREPLQVIETDGAVLRS